MVTRQGLFENFDQEEILKLDVPKEQYRKSLIIKGFCKYDTALRVLILKKSDELVKHGYLTDIDIEEIRKYDEDLKLKVLCDIVARTEIDSEMSEHYLTLEHDLDELRNIIKNSSPKNYSVLFNELEEELNELLK